MHTEVRILKGSAEDSSLVAPETVDLIVTSPPYPMIEMWDELFTAQHENIGERISKGEGSAAFELMHSVLDRVWLQCDRALRPGGIACINIGDATRTLNGDFQLYSNHSRILRGFLALGYAALPDILWRKQTNAPNKFMGSGMLPVGAYVTYEHEYVLILRKGRRRQFSDADEKRRRRESAFFWEERNVWFSDVWQDVKGAEQKLLTESVRKRSAAFPFELPYRLISMFSIRGDHVLDPFAGTGTTLSAALVAGRNATGIELDESLVSAARDVLSATPRFANQYIRHRLVRHMAFVSDRMREKGPMKYVNRYYGFPVVTAQEQDLLLPDVLDVAQAEEEVLNVYYGDRAQEDIVQLWDRDEGALRPSNAIVNGQKNGPLPALGASAQPELYFAKL